jgi:hypothetical protein
METTNGEHRGIRIASADWLRSEIQRLEWSIQNLRQIIKSLEDMEK